MTSAEPESGLKEEQTVYYPGRYLGLDAGVGLPRPHAQYTRSSGRMVSGVLSDLEGENWRERASDLVFWEPSL